MIRFIALLTTILLFTVSCSGGSDADTAQGDLPIITNTVTPPESTPTQAPSTPTPTQVTSTRTPDRAPITVTVTPTLTPRKVIPKSSPTRTPATTSLTVRNQLEWPSNVGTNHFGALGNSLEGFSGAWIRPLPGRFIWGLMEPNKGEYHWEASDRWVRKWQEAGLGVLVMIWPFAQWDQNVCHAEDPPVSNPRVFPQYDANLLLRMYPPCEPETYVSWLSKVVERYDGDGLDDMPRLKYPVRHWEIGNEPDMQSQRHTLFQGNSEDYLNLLKLSYTAVKAADPNANVLIAAPSKWTPEVIEFWQPIFEGGGNFFDIGNMHSLQGSDDFHASEYRRQLDNTGSRSKPFWITEAGVFMGGKALEQEKLARITIPNYASAFAAGAQVVFRLSRGHNTGKVLETYLLAARTFGDFIEATGIAENVVRFDMPDERVVFALWDGGQLPAEVTGKVKVITYKGEESSEDASSVVAQIPILVVVKLADGS